MNWPEELQFIPNARASQKTTSARLDGKHCIITGATSGVGLESAKRLAIAGASLTLVVRDPKKAEMVSNHLIQKYACTPSIIIADFSSLPEVRLAAQQILAKRQKIDVLINNAGIHRTTRELTTEDHEIVFCVNHLASFLFTRLLLDQMLQNTPSRIIQVNSQGHRFGGLDLHDINWSRRHYFGLQGYGASKVAQLLTVWELAKYLNGTSLTVNAVHPGEVKSNIGMDNGLLYRTYQKYIIRPLLKDSHLSGEAIYYLAASPDLQNVTGKYFNRTIEEKPASYAVKAELSSEVWRISEELTNLPRLLI